MLQLQQQHVKTIRLTTIFFAPCLIVFMVKMTFRKFVYRFPPLSSNIQLALHHFPPTLPLTPLRSQRCFLTAPGSRWPRGWIGWKQLEGEEDSQLVFFWCQRCEQGQVGRWAPSGVLPPTLTPWWMSSGFTEESTNESWNAPPHCEIYCLSKIINKYFLLQHLSKTPKK